MTKTTRRRSWGCDARRHLRFEEPELTESGVLVAKILALSVERKRRGGKRRNEREEKQCMTKG